jgi:hypothetical protein
VRRDLFAHLGGEVAASAPEKLIVRQCAKMAVVSRLLGERLLGEDREVTLEATAMFNSWSNMMLRYLSAIGIKKPAQQAVSLEQYLTKRKVKRAAPKVGTTARISAIRPQYPEPKLQIT